MVAGRRTDKEDKEDKGDKEDKEDEEEHGMGNIMSATKQQ